MTRMVENQFFRGWKICWLVALLALWGGEGCLLHAQEDPEQLDSFVELRKKLYSKDVREQAIGAHTLSKLKGNRGVEELLRVLAQEVERKDVVVSVLKVARDIRFLEGVLVRLDDPVEIIREAAHESLRELAKLNGLVTRSLLMLVEGEGRQKLLRVRSIRALGYLRKIEAVPALIRILSAEGSDFKAEAVDALRRITLQSFGNDSKAWEQWWKVNGSRSREEILESVLRSLQEENRVFMEEVAQSTLPLLDGSTFEQLIVAIEHPLWAVRRQAATMLGKAKSPEDPKLVEQRLLRLRKRLGQENHPSVLGSVAMALGRLKDEASLTQLLKRFTDALARRNRNGLSAFSSQDTELLDEMVAAFAAMGNSKAAPSVGALLKDETQIPRLRISSARTLGILGGDSAVSSLVVGLHTTTDLDVLKACAEALGKCRSPEATTALLGILSHEDAGLRWYAADALGELGDQKAVSPLLGLFDDEIARVRQSAVVALGKLGHAKAVKPLGKRLLADVDAQVRRSAAESMEKIGDRQAVPDLARALGDGDPAVADAAWKGLGAIAKDKPELLKEAADLARKVNPSRCVELYLRLIPLLQEGSERLVIERALLSVRLSAKQYQEAFVLASRLAGSEGETPGDQFDLARSLLGLSRADEALPILGKVIQGTGPDVGLFWDAQSLWLKLQMKPEFESILRERLDELSAREEFENHREDFSEILQWLKELEGARKTAEERARVEGVVFDESLAVEEKASRLDLDRDRKHLIELLKSTELERCHAVVLVLRVLSGQSYGFDPAASPEARGQALDRWRDWLTGK